MERPDYRFSDEGPEEQLLWFTSCKDCHWEDDECHRSQSDCTISSCPECKSENIEDSQEWV